MKYRILKTLKMATNHKILMHWHLGKIVYLKTRMHNKSKIDYKKKFAYKGRKHSFVFVFYIKTYKIRRN